MKEMFRAVALMLVDAYHLNKVIYCGMNRDTEIVVIFRVVVVFAVYTNCLHTVQCVAIKL